MTQQYITNAYGCFFVVNSPSGLPVASMAGCVEHPTLEAMYHLAAENAGLDREEVVATEMTVDVADNGTVTHCDSRGICSEVHGSPLTFIATYEV